MKSLIRKCLLICCSLGFLCSTIQGQQAYRLAFSDIQWEDNTATVDLLLSFDQIGALGTSNLVFDFDYSSLSNPVLISHSLPKPFYQTPEIKSINSSIASLNIELLVVKKGLVLHEEPTRIATIQFDRKDQSELLSFHWRKDASPSTEIFLDDNRSQIIQGKVFDIQPPEAPAKGLVGALTIELTQNQKQVFVEFESQRSGNYTLELFDTINGSVHFSQSYDFRIGKNSVLLNTGNFQSGNYTARILFDKDQRIAEMVLTK